MEELEVRLLCLRVQNINPAGYKEDPQDASFRKVCGQLDSGKKIGTILTSVGFVGGTHGLFEYASNKIVEQAMAEVPDDIVQKFYLSLEVKHLEADQLARLFGQSLRDKKLGSDYLKYIIRRSLAIRILSDNGFLYGKAREELIGKLFAANSVLKLTKDRAESLAILAETKKFAEKLMSSFYAADNYLKIKDEVGKKLGKRFSIRISEYLAQKAIVHAGLKGGAYALAALGGPTTEAIVFVADNVVSNVGCQDADDAYVSLDHRCKPISQISDQTFAGLSNKDHTLSIMNADSRVCEAYMGLYRQYIWGVPADSTKYTFTCKDQKQMLWKYRGEGLVGMRVTTEDGKEKLQQVIRQETRDPYDKQTAHRLNYIDWGATSSPLHRALLDYCDGRPSLLSQKPPTANTQKPEVERGKN